LPAPIVNGGGDRFWKWKECQLSRTRDLDLKSSHTAYCHASLIDLYLHIKFHWNRRNFLWTGKLMYKWKDGHLRPTLLGRLRTTENNWGRISESSFTSKQCKREAVVIARVFMILWHYCVTWVTQGKVNKAGLRAPDPTKLNWVGLGALNSYDPTQLNSTGWRVFTNFQHFWTLLVEFSRERAQAQSAQSDSTQLNRFNRMTASHDQAYLPSSCNLRTKLL